MIAPFAEYTLTEKPEWLELSMKLGQPIALDPRRRLTVSRRRGDDISVINADERLFSRGWGGTRNHTISFEDDAWVVSHLGHQSPLLLNDERTWGTHRLESGDRVAPAQGLVFTFTLRAELEPLAEELARINWAPLQEARVLCDWVMERTGLDHEAALLAHQHFTLRSEAGRTG